MAMQWIRDKSYYNDTTSPFLGPQRLEFLGKFLEDLVNPREAKWTKHVRPDSSQSLVHERGHSANLRSPCFYDGWFMVIYSSASSHNSSMSSTDQTFEQKKRSTDLTSGLLIIGYRLTANDIAIWRIYILQSLIKQKVVAPQLGLLVYVIPID